MAVRFGKLFPDEVKAQLVRSHSLQSGHELRAIIPPGQHINVRVVEGSCEEFGRELLPCRDYVTHGRTAIYTWEGCLLEVKGVALQEYEAPNLGMRDYLSFSSILNSRRQLAAIKHRPGPRVLITGSGSSGKSSLCSLLCTYAVRAGWTPIFVELDTRGATDKRHISILPGAIGATVMSTVDTMDYPSDSLCFFYGHAEPEEHRELFMELCQHLAIALGRKVDRNLVNTKWQTHQDERSKRPLIAASGFLVNAPHDAKSELVLELVALFHIDVVVVVDNPSLKHKLSSRTAAAATVVALPKQEGVVAVDRERLRGVRLLELRLVFLDKHSLPSSALPADCSASSQTSVVVKWSGSAHSLQSIVLGVSAATTLAEVATAPCLGIALVKSVEEREIDVDETNDVPPRPGIGLHVEYWVDVQTVVSDFKTRICVVPTDRQLKWWT